DYRVVLRSENQYQEKSIHYKTQIETLFTLSSQIFKEILDDDLVIEQVIYKLVKSDPLIIAYKDFMKIRSCLDALSTKNVEYENNTYSKKITIVSGIEFVQFMYYLELLVLQLFEKHIEYESDILIYINDHITNN
ncbi:17411_t:CDS:2, partial [Dentiscutata erythropus]